MEYNKPTPEADAFMTLIDDTEIDLGMVESKLQTLEIERDEAINVCRRIMDAIAGHTEWHPSPEVDVDNWNEDAHIEVTLTVADCRALKAVLRTSAMTCPEPLAREMRRSPASQVPAVEG